MLPDFNDNQVRLMGILNITPDSFSDGGENLSPENAIVTAMRMKAEGAALLDIGAESTRPYDNAVLVDAVTERARLAPVLKEIVALGLPVSIDTMKAEIAEFALKAGAKIINDVWGLQRDAQMAPLAAAYRAHVIVVHNRDNADDAVDIMADMHDFFQRSFIIALAAGLPREKLILDPGIGFGKTLRQNLIVLKNMEELKRYRLPVLVGASRKRFIGEISGTEPRERGPGTIAANFEAVRRGAAILRVHEVAQMAQALKVSEAIVDA